MKRHAAPAIFLLASLASFATELKTWDRYECIVNRAPFGPIYKEGVSDFDPPPDNTTDPVPEDTGPKLSDIIKLSAITVYGGYPAAGFTDTSDGKSYYLYEGRSAGEFTLLEVHSATKSVLLRKGDKEEEIFVNGQAPEAAPSPANAASSGIRAVVQPQASTTTRAPGYKDLQRQRYEESRRKDREKAEEELRRRQEELRKLSKEEMDKKLREYNLELIRSGNGTPLPIELNREELVKLGEEGFDVADAIQALDEKEAAPHKETPAERLRRRRAEAAAGAGETPPAP